MDLSGFLSYIPSLPFYLLTHAESPIILFISGNRGGKNASVVIDFILRLFRCHPVKKKNFYDNMPCRTIRFVSETLPAKIEDNEASRNTQYPELIKRLPKELIVSDISTKRPILTVQDPFSSQHFYIEFTSYVQDVQAQAGVERLYVWMDEVPPYNIFEENYARLITTGGDLIMTLTPAEGDVDWVYNVLYNNARHIYRTPPVIRWYKENGEKKLPYEYNPNNRDITIIHSATDDNPYLYELYKKDGSEGQSYDDFISSRFYMLDDKVSIAVRRYGIFSYVSGRIFQEYNPSIHLIDGRVYFPDGIPTEYKHFRSIDYHESNDWACIWCSLSPTNEFFIWDELKISPISNTLSVICESLIAKSKDYYYAADLIDPRGQIKSVQTATSPVEFINRYFYRAKMDGLCRGAYFRSYDTTTTRGRDEIRMRLANSVKCGRPFNNRVNGEYLPTLWVFNNCRNVSESLKNWSYETWADRSAFLVKDKKEKPQQKYSHFCTALEGIMKERVISVPFKRDIIISDRNSIGLNYFKQLEYR